VPKPHAGSLCLPRVDFTQLANAFDREWLVAHGVAGLAAHLDEACGGTISEILDGNPPHTPRGCFAQASSVSETLRAYHHLARSRTASRAGVTRFSEG
jgi:glycogen debranching enzyme